MQASGLLRRSRWNPLVVLCFFVIFAGLFISTTEASYGDRLLGFRKCVKVCINENCETDQPTTIPLYRRLLLWDCPSECDYTCQHIVTERRLAKGHPVVQFHGKWPFYRFLGIQEPMSMIFSLGNMYAHWHGLQGLQRNIPTDYSLRPYYLRICYVGLATWFFSTVFHTRDFPVTEQLDYFAAGLSVLYGMYYTVVRLFRLDKPSPPRRRTFMRLWSLICILAYVGHVAYLKFVRWNYTYNMAANVVVGMTQNLMWIGFSLRAWLRGGPFWQTWPGLMVLWLITALSLELFDFPPMGLYLDAHSLWHASTIIPAMVWYQFLINDALHDIAQEKEKNKLKD